MTKLAIVGAFDGTHLGGSLWRSARHAGIEAIKLDVSEAMAGSGLLRAARWHLSDRKPLRFGQFQRKVMAVCAEAHPDVLISTGAAPLSQSTLCALRSRGIVCVNYSSDDPWNQAMRASWHLRALPEYDVIFTPRRSNIDDFRRIGCTTVRYLPFGYDECRVRFCDELSPLAVPDVLFVGGADCDRVAFMTEFMRTGPRVGLVGGYWDRFSAMRPHALGLQPPETVSSLTVAAKVNLCLVRRANRDGHVMRSFEIAAIGGCMLAENTAEHQDIFGPDGEAVVYFRSARQAAQRAQLLLTDPVRRRYLSESLRARILAGGHTYRDRLETMLKVAAEIQPKLEDAALEASVP